MAYVLMINTIICSKYLNINLDHELTLFENLFSSIDEATQETNNGLYIEHAITYNTNNNIATEEFEEDSDIDTIISDVKSAFTEMFKCVLVATRTIDSLCIVEHVHNTIYKIITTFIIVYCNDTTNIRNIKDIKEAYSFIDKTVPNLKAYIIKAIKKYDL